MKHTLITGGAGFIGSHITDQLVNAGHKVFVIDNLSTGSINNLNPKAKFKYTDIKNKKSVDDLFKQYNFDYVFHLAAQINLRESIKNPSGDANTNILGTINLLNNCKGINKFIFASTGGAIYYPEYNTLPWTEDSKVEPQSPYGLSKFCSEQYIKLMAQQLGFNYTILRLSNVYGPRQNAHGEAGVIAIFKEKILKDEPCIIFGDGNQTRDFVYVQDVAKAFVLAGHNNLNGIFNVCSETEISVNDLVKKMYSVLNKQTNVVYSKKIDGELLRSCLSNKKLSKYTNWKCNYTLDAGLNASLL